MGWPTIVHEQARFVLGDGYCDAGQSCRKPAFDELLYRKNPRIKNLCARLKSFRRIASRDVKVQPAFTAFVSLSYFILWLKY